MRMRAVFSIVLAAGIGAQPMVAQMASGAHAGPAEGSIATPAQAFDSQLSLVEAEMMSAVRAMPADKFGFAPSAGMFAAGQTPKFMGVRTFAQQATHVAESLYFFSSVISGAKPDVDLKAMETLTAKDDVVKALGAAFAFTHRAVGTLTPANAFEVIHSPEPGFQTRGTLASFAVSHAFDHYGQMVEYLRMNGIVPPASAR